MSAVAASRMRRSVRVVLAIAMMAIGVMHFANPEPFMKIVPAYLPAHRALVLISGFFEIAGGAGLLVARVRTLAAWGLAALYVAVFPANLNQAMNQISFEPGHPIPPAALWLRLPLQLVLIGLAVWLAKGEPRGDPV